MNILTTFAAGLSSWGAFIKKNWKKILLWAALGPILYAAFSLLVAGLVIGFVKFVMWTTTFPGWVNFTNNHPRAIVFSVLGSLLLYAILCCLYQDGKKKLLKTDDKISSI